MADEHGRLRAITEADLPLLVEWRNHESIRSFMFNHDRVTVEGTRAWFECESANARAHLLLFELGGRPAGYVRFLMLADGGTVDWGFYGAPDRPPGTGLALGIAALDHAFDVLKAHRVFGQVLAHNLASIRFHERLGFTREGTLRGHHFDGDRWHDVLCYGLLRHEWAASRSPTDA